MYLSAGATPALITIPLGFLYTLDNSKDSTKLFRPSDIV